MFKVIDDLDHARALYEAGLLWYRIRTTESGQFKGAWGFPVPEWWKPSKHTYKHAQFSVHFED